MEWTGYNDCCLIKAASLDNKFCGDCQTPLLRCRGWDACAQLLEPGGHCPKHVAPSLAVDESEVVKLEVGDNVALPLIFSNNSPVGGALSVGRIRKQVSGGEWEDVNIPFDRLPAIESRTFTVDSGVLETGGRTRITIVIEVQSMVGSLMEDVAFQSTVYIDVKQRETRSISITKSVQITGSNFEAGASGVVSTGDTIEAESEYGSSSRPIRIDPLQRDVRYEVKHGLRGYNDGRGRVPLHVEMKWTNFPEGQHPTLPKPFLFSPHLRCGRDSLTHSPPNDVRTLYFDRGTGDLNRDLSKQISGHHFDLFVQNDRLYLRDSSSNGTCVNGEALRKDQEEYLADGDSITLLQGIAAQPLEYRVSLQSRHGLVSTIEIRRSC